MINIININVNEHTLHTFYLITVIIIMMMKETAGYFERSTVSVGCFSFFSLQFFSEVLL